MVILGAKRGPKGMPKLTKNLKKRMQNFDVFSDLLQERIFERFGPKIVPKSTQNGAEIGPGSENGDFWRMSRKPWTVVSKRGSGPPQIDQNQLKNNKKGRENGGRKKKALRG